MSGDVPSPVAAEEIERKRSWAAAIELCAEAAGYDLDKQAHQSIGIDQARWSRIKSGREGIKWEQLCALMDSMGNDIPLLWMLAQRGYEIRTVRHKETEYERRIRELEEELGRQRVKNEALAEALRGERP